MIARPYDAGKITTVVPAAGEIMLNAELRIGEPGGSRRRGGHKFPAYSISGSGLQLRPDAQDEAVHRKFPFLS